MAHVNENYLKLPGNYLFATIAKKVEAYSKAHPEANIIRLGIGDVTRPLASAIIDAMHKAVDEMGKAETFRGYGPEQGYDFLRQAIIDGDYKTRGIDLDLDEVFVATALRQTLLHPGNLRQRPQIRRSRSGLPGLSRLQRHVRSHGRMERRKGIYDGVVYLPCTPENGFKAVPPTEKVDIVYLCNPSNPTGTAMSKEELANWVSAAKKNNFIIIYDSAYETYITEPDVPHSIFEVEGAKEVAIELRSYSKCAGFTGTRCSYVVVPHACTAYKKDGTAVELNPLWNRRQCTFFNGTPYIVQRAAEAYYSPEGQKQCLADVKYYMENAHIIRDGLTKAGFTVYGATNSPYAWVQTPNGMKSWDFFDLLLEKAHVVTTPVRALAPTAKATSA